MPLCGPETLHLPFLWTRVISFVSLQYATGGKRSILSAILAEPLKNVRKNIFFKNQTEIKKSLNAKCNWPFSCLSASRCCGMFKYLSQTNLCLCHNIYVREVAVLFTTDEFLDKIPVFIWEKCPEPTRIQTWAQKWGFSVPEKDGKAEKDEQMMIENSRTSLERLGGV